MRSRQGRETSPLHFSARLLIEKFPVTSSDRTFAVDSLDRHSPVFACVGGLDAATMRLGVFTVVLVFSLCSAGATENGQHVITDSQGLARALSQADAAVVALKGEQWGASLPVADREDQSFRAAFSWAWLPCGPYARAFYHQSRAASAGMPRSTQMARCRTSCWHIFGGCVALLPVCASSDVYSALTAACCVP